jgi:hypothetical protein
MTTPEMQQFFIVEIRNYHRHPYTEFPCMFLSDSLEKAVEFIKNETDHEEYRPGKWYWAVIKMLLNDESGGEIAACFDKNGNETTEKIILGLKD